MRIILTFLLLISIGFTSFAQKAIGYGVEISVLSVKPNLRKWVNKTNGYEFFAGIGSELENFKPNDVEFGLKYLKGIIYNRSDRTYFGVVGKWKWANIYGSNKKTSLTIPGILIGKEWFTKRINRKGFAIELGYQYGIKEFYAKNYKIDTKEKFEEFPLILNLRYSFYQKR